MRRAHSLRRAGTWPRHEALGTATLDYDQRHRRRLRLETDAGEAFLLDLAQASVLGDGDGLVLDDGGWIGIRAAPEPLLEIRAVPVLLGRLAWHIGNRHLPAAIEAERILIRRDHVIEEMLAGLGATLRPVLEPFSPEGGAYDGAATGEAVSHSHSHAHDHDHSDGHKHVHGRHDHDHHHHHHDHDDDHGAS